MGWPEMVVGIVLITAVAQVLKARYGIRKNRYGDEVHVDHRENQQLRDEVKQLKDRLAVIEQITIEKENSLSREIERLRDR